MISSLNLGQSHLESTHLLTLAQIQGGDQLQELRQIIDVKNAR
ncbi:hypothetical protein BANRA_01124 [Klebsiella variicola]|nr:hypothetical protein BANRA_01124 [Klebsiella variicola]